MQPNSLGNGDDQQPKPIGGRARKLLSAFILVATVAAVGRQVWLAWQSLDGKIPEVNISVAGWSTVLYAVGWFLLASPWLILLAAQTNQWRALDAWCTYLVSHLGKYVPGKAMVVLIRCHRRPATVPMRVPILTSVHETSLAMAAAATTACVWLVFLLGHSEGQRILWSRPIVPIALAALAIGFSGLASPPVFGRLHHAIERKYRLAEDVAPPPTNWRSFAIAFVSGILAWSLQGVSYAMALSALDTGKLTMHGCLVATAAYPASVVLGFLAMTPGQFGVREWALIEMVAPFIPNRGAAVFAPLLHRAITLTTEVAVAGVLALWRRRAN